MAKPTQLPRWANGGTAVVTPEPSEGQKDTGWLVSQKPPRNYFNWWMLRVYQWCVYLDGLTSEALTWASKHTFSAGLASSVAPSAATDVVRKTELDAQFVAPIALSAFGAGWVAGTPSPGGLAAGGLACLYGRITSTGATSFNSIGSPIPAALRPSANRTLYGQGLVGGLPRGLEIVITTTGGISISRRDDGGLLGANASGDSLLLDGLSYCL